MAKAQESEPRLSQAYGIGTVIAVGVLGLLGYYIYQRCSPQGATNADKVTPAEVHPQNEETSSKWSNQILLSRITKWTRRVSLMTHTKQR